MQGGGGCSWVEIFSVKGHAAGSAAVIQPMSSSPVFSFLHPSLQGSHLQGRLAAQSVGGSAWCGSQKPNGII